MPEHPASANITITRRIGRIGLSALCYELFFLRSAHRFFIAIDKRFLPAGVRPPRLRFFGFVFVVEPLGRPRRFLPRPGMTDPTRASMAQPRRSFSFVKSASNLSRSKIHSFGALAVRSRRLSASDDSASYRILDRTRVNCSKAIPALLSTRSSQVKIHEIRRAK